MLHQLQARAHQGGAHRRGVRHGSRDTVAAAAAHASAPISHGTSAVDHRQPRQQPLLSEMGPRSKSPDELPPAFREAPGGDAAALAQQPAQQPATPVTHRAAGAGASPQQ